MKKMTRGELFFVRFMINVSIIMSMLFPVSFFIKGSDIAETAVPFQPFADCQVKIITLMSFSPAIAVMISLAVYGVVLMRVTFRNL